MLKLVGAREVVQKMTIELIETDCVHVKIETFVEGVLKQQYHVSMFEGDSAKQDYRFDFDHEINVQECGGTLKIN